MSQKGKGMTERNFFWGAVLCLFLLVSCAAPLTDVTQDFSSLKPTRIAVLPAMNETNDLDAPRVFRILAAAELTDKGYHLVPFQQIDEMLKQKDIQEAGQLESLTPQEIGEITGADGLLYTRVMSYGRQVGVHLKMEGSFTLVNSRSGQKIWYSELGVSDNIVLEGGAVALGAELLFGKKSRDDFIKAYLAARLARQQRAVGKFRSHPIRQEVFQTITIDMDKIPLLDDFFSRNFRTLPPP
jgi:hypothetical protein